MHDKPVLSHFVCEDIRCGHWTAGPQKGVKVRKKERKRWKERKQKDPVLLMLAFLLASGIRVGKGRAFSPVRVTERWLSTFSLTPALCACV